MSVRYTYGLAFPHQLPDASGVAHLVEHLVGHGPRRSQTRYLLPALVDRDVLESFTGLTYRGFTAYVFSGRSETMDVAFDLVRQSCLDPVLDREVIAAERGWPVGDGWRPGVLEDEVTLRYTWLRGAVAAVTAAVHPDDPLSHDPAGQPSLLRRLTDDDVKAFHQRWYQPSSMLACRAAEGEPFEFVDGSSAAGWNWQPQIRQSALPVSWDDNGLPHVGVALCWRVGVFPSADRGRNLVTARCLSAVLAMPDLRRRLGDAGWAIGAGPIVDSTLPDPCVVAVVQPGDGTPGVEVAREVANGAVLATIVGHSDFRKVRALAGQMTEPLVPGPWANRAVLALAAGLADGRMNVPAVRLATGPAPNTPADSDEILDAVLHCLDSDTDSQPSAIERSATFDVRTPRASIPRLRSFPRTGSVSSASAYDTAVAHMTSAETVDGPNAGAFDLIVGADGRHWPDNRMTVSIRLYPSVDLTGPDWLDGSWHRGAQGRSLPPPRLWVSGSAIGPRMFAEWLVPVGEGRFGPVLARTAIDEMWGDARRLARAVFAATVRAASGYAKPHPLERVDLRREASGHWRLIGQPRRPNSPPFTVYAVQRTSGRSAVVTEVRRTMRDLGYYAIGGRVLDDWGREVFTLHCPAVDGSAGARLAGAVAAATARVGRSGPVEPGRPPPASSPDPQAAAEALQTRIRG